MSYMYIKLVWNDQAIILEHPERVFDHLYGFCEDDEKGWKSGLHTNTRVQLWINNIIKPKYSMLKSWILGDAASVSQLWHNLFSKYPQILYFLENSGRICFSRWNNCLRNISSTYFLAYFSHSWNLTEGIFVQQCLHSKLRIVLWDQGINFVRKCEV